MIDVHDEYCLHTTVCYQLSAQYHLDKGKGFYQRVPCTSSHMSSHSQLAIAN